MRLKWRHLNQGFWFAVGDDRMYYSIRQVVKGRYVVKIDSTDLKAAKAACQQHADANTKGAK